MKESLYLETSVVSYFTVRLSRDIIVLAHQEITRQWWEKAIQQFEIYISEPVMEEISTGDLEAVKRRLEKVDTFKRLELNVSVEKMAQVYVDRLKIPKKSALDAVHLAAASIHNMDYLVTWNCRYIANAVMRSQIEAACRNAGYAPAIICTPDELMEPDYDNK